MILKQHSPLLDSNKIFTSLLFLANQVVLNLIFLSNLNLTFLSIFRVSNQIPISNQEKYQVQVENVKNQLQMHFRDFSSVKSMFLRDKVERGTNSKGQFINRYFFPVNSLAEDRKQEHIGTIHILRQRLQGGRGGSENAFFAYSQY